MGFRRGTLASYDVGLRRGFRRGFSDTFFPSWVLQWHWKCSSLTQLFSTVGWCEQLPVYSRV